MSEHNESIAQIESSLADIEIELAYIKAAIAKLKNLCCFKLYPVGDTSPWKTRR